MSKLGLYPTEVLIFMAGRVYYIIYIYIYCFVFLCNITKLFHHLHRHHHHQQQHHGSVIPSYNYIGKQQYIFKENYCEPSFLFYPSVSLFHHPLCLHLSSPLISLHFTAAISLWIAYLCQFKVKLTLGFQSVCLIQDNFL